MWYLISDLNVDCEYNKNNQGTKLLDGQLKIPDLIIHRRNLNNHTANKDNTLIVEVKGYWNYDENRIKDDKEKLIKFTSMEHGYHYQLGIFLVLGKTEEDCKYCYYVHGEEKDINELI